MIPVEGVGSGSRVEDNDPKHEVLSKHDPQSAPSKLEPEAEKSSTHGHKQSDTPLRRTMGTASLRNTIVLRCKLPRTGLDQAAPKPDHTPSTLSNNPEP